jgi:hypothetical protein
MAKPKNVKDRAKITLDTLSKKNPRGPHRRIAPSTVIGRANNYRWILEQVWESLWPSLSEAQSAEEVVAALQCGRPYEQEFLPWVDVIITVLKEKRFPKRRVARINFLADSIAGAPNVSPRRSRDICLEERAKAERAHHIIRFEVYIECSCGYKGHSNNHACPQCGAKISFPAHLGSMFL